MKEEFQPFSGWDSSFFLFGYRVEKLAGCFAPVSNLWILRADYALRMTP